MIVVISTMAHRLDGCRRVFSELKRQTLRPSRIFLHFDGCLPDRELCLQATDITWNRQKTGTVTRLKLLGSLPPDEIVAVMDDDISFPPDYLERGSAAATKLRGLVTYHGGDWLCLGAPAGKLMLGFEVLRPTPVLVAGIGVSFARARVYQLALKQPALEHFSYSCDLLVSFTCWRRGIPIYRGASTRRWLTWKIVRGFSVYRDQRARISAVYDYIKQAGWPGKP